MIKPKTITNADAKNLIYWLDGKYKLIAELAIETGLRISDILNLRFKDIKSRNMRIYEQKSRQHRNFEISEDLYRELRYTTLFHSDDAYVFHSARNPTKPIHRVTVHRHIKKALLWAQNDCSVHSLRKLYAQNVLHDTGSISAVQRALNHQKITTTLTYLDIDVDKLTKELKPCQN